MNTQLLKSVLKPGVTAKSVDKAVYSVIPVDEQGASYDSMARAYDWLIGNTVYNRVVWGNWSKAYRDAATDAIRNLPDGPVLDCGCGSLVFTAAAYRSVPFDRFILYDRSIGMLRRGAKRLTGATFLQGDALALPFADEKFGISFAWGLAHIFERESDLFQELRRVTKAGGLVMVSMLVVADRSPGDWVLSKLFESGEVARPKLQLAVRNEFAGYFKVESETLRGNMLYLTGRV